MRLVELGICPFRFGVVVKGRALVRCKLFGSTRPPEECVDCAIRIKTVEAIKIFGEDFVLG